MNKTRGARRGSFAGAVPASYRAAEMESDCSYNAHPTTNFRRATGLRLAAVCKAAFQETA